MKVEKSYTVMRLFFSFLICMLLGFVSSNAWSGSGSDRFTKESLRNNMNFSSHSWAYNIVPFPVKLLAG